MSWADVRNPLFFTKRSVLIGKIAFGGFHPFFSQESVFLAQTLNRVAPHH
jgi:hypothetical protein